MINNPILRGFAPDPSIMRNGDDYYIATSTFEWWPGVRIFHSKNLVDFDQIPSPLRSYSQLDMTGDAASCGVWAPDLTFDGKRYFLTYTDVKTKKYFYNTHNYLVYCRGFTGSQFGTSLITRVEYISAEEYNNRYHTEIFVSYLCA